MSPDPMSPQAVTRRLRAMSERSDLLAARRLAAKVDMSPEAVTRRMRVQAALRDACLTWRRRRPSGAEVNPTARLAPPPGRLE